jgi:hypothetical protein
MNRKNIPYLLALIAFCVLTACSEKPTVSTDNLTLSDVTVTLTGIESNAANFKVELRNTQTNSIFAEMTNAQGTALFHVTPGIYEATASKKELRGGNTYYIYNGTSGQITVREGQATPVTMEMKRAKTSQVVIKELYNGGCMKDDGVTMFQYDKCFILYNNSAEPAVLDNLCMGFAAPANAQATNRNYDETGKLVYEEEGFIPVWNGVWYFPATLTIEPYGQVVVNITGAIDNTLTVTASVNYAKEEYYCMYDPESGYNNTSYYPTPSAVIPTSHYLKAKFIALGNAWIMSVTSPALVMFQTKDMTPAEFGEDADYRIFEPGSTSQIDACFKVPAEWVIDGVEVFSSSKKEDSKKRLTDDIDGGYVYLTNYLGHTVYRNVDKQATEALPENSGKLVYGYALGCDGSTDPSGIDAEASMKKGAHIVYLDTNNSTTDFHERQKCSLKGE